MGKSVRVEQVTAPEQDSVDYTREQDSVDYTRARMKAVIGAIPVVLSISWSALDSVAGRVMIDRASHAHPAQLHQQGLSSQISHHPVVAFLFLMAASGYLIKLGYEVHEGYENAKKPSEKDGDSEGGFVNNAKATLNKSLKKLKTRKSLYRSLVLVAMCIFAGLDIRSLANAVGGGNLALVVTMEVALIGLILLSSFSESKEEVSTHGHAFHFFYTSEHSHAKHPKRKMALGLASVLAAGAFGFIAYDFAIRAMLPTDGIGFQIMATMAVVVISFAACSSFYKSGVKFFQEYDHFNKQKSQTLGSRDQTIRSNKMTFEKDVKYLKKAKFVLNVGLSVVLAVALSGSLMVAGPTMLFPACLAAGVLGLVGSVMTNTFYHMNYAAAEKKMLQSRGKSAKSWVPNMLQKSLVSNLAFLSGIAAFYVAMTNPLLAGNLALPVVAGIAGVIMLATTALISKNNNIESLDMGSFNMSDMHKSMNIYDDNHLQSLEALDLNSADKSEDNLTVSDSDDNLSSKNTMGDDAQTLEANGEGNGDEEGLSFRQ